MTSSPAPYMTSSGRPGRRFLKPYCSGARASGWRPALAVQRAGERCLVYLRRPPFQDCKVDIAGERGLRLWPNAWGQSNIPITYHPTSPRREPERMCDSRSLKQKFISVALSKLVTVLLDMGHHQYVNTVIYYRSLH